MRRKTGKVLYKAGAFFTAFCFAFLLPFGVYATSVSDVTVKAAPLTKASTALDGMVRVYLSSLGSPTSLTLTIAGNYTLSNGTALTSGETLYVGFNSSTGTITMTRNGSQSNMGNYFALRRHSATGTNGITIAQARKPSNPYPGDLSFQAVRQSSGSYKLYTVAHIYIENYLYGVLPYEMGTSAPAEALKAQAVAARTYTVRMMQSRTSGYYDVVDTTSDQVYNGTPSSNASCVSAVDATKGIVLKYGSGYAATYYSASNGGQTESIANIWGSSGYPYLDVHDDPFDYNNPDSIVKKTTVYANGSGNNASLMALLKTKAIAALQSAGYSANTSNTTIQLIKSVTAHTPMYASPSRLYTKMDFSLSVTTANSSGSTVSASATVTCDIFSELESMLSMSIQSGKNELWSVSKSSTAFTLQARRYGHGMGMSQRGAMYMGKLGYTYDKIIGFYYPGCSRVSTSFTNTILAANSDEEITSEEDAASVDENTDTGACTAVITLVSNSAKLAIRAGKSTSAAILGVAPGSSPVSVYASDGTWCLIKFGAIVGYVPLNALTITGTPATTSDQSVTSIVGFAKVTASDYLNLRESGSYSATVVTTASSGAVLTVLDKTSSWAHVQYGATVAYAATAYLSFSDTYPSDTVSTGASTATVTTEDGNPTYLRQTASTSGTVLAQLPNGTVLNVSKDDGSWATVTYNGTTGYVLSSCLTFEGDSTDTATDSPGTGEVWATVGTGGAVLRATADESASTVTEIETGKSVIVSNRGDTWCAARYNGKTGYILTASLSFSSSETPTPTATTTATVATQSGSLNMRTEASAGSTILTTIPKGATVTVTSKGTIWCGVTYSGYSGYVMTAYLQFADETDTDDETVDTTATVTTVSGSLNLRQLPKAGSSILTTIPRLAIISVQTKGVEWCAVTYNGVSGYVMTAFLTFASAQDTATPESTTTPESTVTPESSATPADSTTPETTVSPTPTATATDAMGNISTAIVTTPSGSLNLRSDMLPGSRVLTTIPRGTTITVLQKLEAWTQTNYNGYTGYVMNTYLTFPSGESTSGSTVTTATVTTASGSLNLRTEPYGTIIMTIPQYASVTVSQRGSSWCYVQYAGVYGYVMTAYLSFSEIADTATTAPTDTATVTPTVTPDTSDTSTVATPSPSPTPAPTSTPEAPLTAVVNTVSGSLNLRAAASTSAEILTTIPRLTTITVSNKGTLWSQVYYGSYTGYVQNAFLTFSVVTTVSPAESVSTVAPTTNTGTTAWVYTSSGSLNLRAAASSSATIVTTLPRLTQVTVWAQNGSWSQISYGIYSGYCMSQYLVSTCPAELGTTATVTSTSTPETNAGTSNETDVQADTETENTGETEVITEDPTLKAPDQTLYATITPKDGAETLSLQTTCVQSDGWLLEMIAGSQVQVLRKGNNWCEVMYFGQPGFCLTEGLTMIE